MDSISRKAVVYIAMFLAGGTGIFLRYYWWGSRLGTVGTGVFVFLCFLLATNVASTITTAGLALIAPGNRKNRALSWAAFGVCGTMTALCFAAWLETLLKL